MNKTIKPIGVGVVAAVATFLALLFSGLGTTSITNSEGNVVTMTTVKLGVNEFGLLMILVIFISVVAAGLAFNAVDKK